MLRSDTPAAINAHDGRRQKSDTKCDIDMHVGKSKKTGRLDRINARQSNTERLESGERLQNHN